MTVEPQLYNSRIINNFIGLIRKRYREVNIDEILQYAEMNSYEVTDEAHWFTQTQIDRFHEKVVELVGSDISREAGRYAASGECMGIASKYLLGIIGPANAFPTIRKVSSRLTRSSIYTCRTLSDNRVEITVAPVEGATERPFQCENRMGFFEAVLMMFNYELPEIDHSECMFKGGECCRYVVSWKRTRHARLKRLRNILAPVLVALVVALIPVVGWEAAGQMLAVLLVFILGSSSLADRLEKDELAGALLNLRDSSQNLVDQIELNYNNARMVNDVGQAISKQSEIDDVLENVTSALENRLCYDRCVILLADPQRKRLVFRTGFGYTEEQLTLLKETRFHLQDLSSKGAFVEAFREQHPILVNDFSDVSRFHSARSVAFSAKMQAQSFICCPIVCEGVSLGVLAVDNVKTKRNLVKSDISLLMGIAPVIGMSIRNAMYMERERRLAEQLQQSQKMEAVGQLAGGIAHDFNNLLTAMIGYIGLAQMTLEDGHLAHKFLEQLQNTADRATNLTQGLLAFSRKQVNDPRPLDLNQVLENIRNLLSRLISEEIDLDISLSEKRLQIMADCGQIEQIIMNLVTNARDAMSGAGVLTIRTSLCEMNEEFIQEHGYGAPGKYALLSVADTGAGMDEATKAKIFEPFYTTKETGKGTGLGMSIVYGIVQQHDGYLEAESEPGAGTTFSIYFPLLEKDWVSHGSLKMPEITYGGTETILVAEDAPEVRRLASEVLKQNGYSVIEAVDGQDAVQKFMENRDEIDLLIMDVVMPKMNGKEAYSEIAKITPGMKVLFTSGYTPDDVARKGVTFAKENFLPKPASPQALLRKVREVLLA